ncbi:MAG: response regulator transcription factor [Bacteroidetes bacterium]|nr:response regulator transcription factor [Bacteroidota bacterium]
MKTLIIEDEKKSRDMLAGIIRKNCPQLEIVGLANNVKEGVEMVKTLNPELLFLDISMPDGSGFDLLEKLQGHKFELIFATASDQHAIRAIKYSACDYLLKPIDIDELKEAVDKAVKKKVSSPPSMENLQFLIQQLKRADDNFQKITLPTGNAFEIVNIKDIIRCESDGSYTYFYLTDKRKLMVSAGMKHYEELLPEYDFIRIHHQHLINMNHVMRFLKVDGGYAVMTDGAQIEISRRKKDQFLERLA